MRKILIFSVGVFVIAASIAIGVGVSSAGEEAPRGCAASNVDYYYDADTGQIDAMKLSELTWMPVSARDSEAVIGCVPYRLWDPTTDDNRALLAYGQGDYDVPLPIFNFQGELVGYFVVNKGSVSLTDAIAGGDVPGRLVEDPPEVTDFDPDFVPAAG